MELICLFFPAILSIFIYFKYINVSDDYKLIDVLGYYVIFNLIINFLILLITNFVFDVYLYVYTVSFSLKYLLISFPISLALPFFIKKINFNDVKSWFCEKKYLSLLCSVKEIYVKYKKLIYSLYLLIIIIILFILFDISLRNITFSITKFYQIDSLPPFYFDIVYIILIYGLLLILPKIFSKIILIFVYLFSLVLYIINFMLLNIKSEAFTIYELENASEGFDFINFIFKEISFSFILIIIISFILFLLSYLLLGKIKKYKCKKSIKYKKIKMTIILIIIFLISMVIRNIGINKIEKCKDGEWNCYIYPRYYYDNFINPKKSLSVAGLYEYTIRDVYIFVKDKMEKKVSKDEVEEIIDKRNLIIEKNEYSGIFKDKNLIMIMLESIDSVALNEESMPTLMYMKENGWDFKKRYSQFSSGASTFATEFTSLTGLYYRNNNNYNEYIESIPSMFKKSGYSVSSIHENKSAFYNRNVYHKNFGFENSYFLHDLSNKYEKHNDVQLVSKDEIYNGIISKDLNTEKFMSYIITISAHGPYKDNYICSFNKKYSESEYECYNHLASITDDFLKLLLKRLEEDKLLDDTVILLYSDHYAYAYSYTDKDYELYEQVDNDYNIKNLPFIFYSTDIEAKKFNDIIVEDVDIVPTILNLFGIDYDPNIYIGADIFSKNHKNLAVFTDYSWYDGKIYSFNEDVDKTTKIYKENSKYAKKILDLNDMIMDSNYYN